uniref:Bombolitin-8 n=1 Tax=Bombus lapidarius TaxID=30192 RepID=BOL8_BOMLA|nr:RecName: Full=Bombolitin-8 [Bombus lapidarius]
LKLKSILGKLGVILSHLNK